MTDQEQIDALKAQVNCLRDELRATHDFLWKAGVADYIARDIEKVLETTPEQCLAEVKAKAIEEYKKEQAEIMRLDIATKVMTVTI